MDFWTHKLFVWGKVGRGSSNQQSHRQAPVSQTGWSRSSACWVVLKFKAFGRKIRTTMGPNLKRAPGVLSEDFGILRLLNFLPSGRVIQNWKSAPKPREVYSILRLTARNILSLIDSNFLIIQNPTLIIFRFSNGSLLLLRVFLVTSCKSFAHQLIENLQKKNGQELIPFKWRK